MPAPTFAINNYGFTYINKKRGASPVTRSTTEGSRIARIVNEQRPAPRCAYM